MRVPSFNRIDKTACKQRDAGLLRDTWSVIVDDRPCPEANKNRIARDADDDFGHSRSLKVIRCYVNRHGIYDFLSS